MTTFSQLVDKMVAESKRPDLATEIASYLNQTIRELHFEPSRGNAVMFSSNFVEDQVTATSESGQIWSIPDAAIFQAMAIVRFDNMFTDRNEPVFAQLVNPGPLMNTKDHYYYRAADYFVFGGRLGYGGLGSKISLGYFLYPRGLKYYASGSRPAIYDVEDGWTYPPEASTPELQLAARNRVTNWILMRWSTVIEEGLRAKIFKRLSDEGRQRTSYSLYMQLRQGLYTAEIADLGGLV